MYWHFASLRVKNKLKSSGRLNSQHWEDDMFRPPPVRPLHIWHSTMEVLSKEFITTLGPVESQLYRIVTYWEVFSCAVLSPSSSSPLDCRRYVRCLQSWRPPAIFTTLPLDRSVSTSWAALRGVSLEACCCFMGISEYLHHLLQHECCVHEVLHVLRILCDFSSTKHSMLSVPLSFSTAISKEEWNKTRVTYVTMDPLIPDDRHRFSATQNPFS